ncbi:murein biosynthesis integral membrane protein MurJ [Clostridium sp. DSM 100503]|uniref:murein biosynthesis integral membrane protein MurJ n=1 Tax=Clostridium sp. DSM 100503 TaxID=2963282 RepID=UPI00214A4505|nr:murein biosynthesis integral membrane protein MurJ [Clostridium sp. DSM 100503]MCR1949704.1 murein biosynthesis integral membrane protein MurJ [Clostridium sp. DSM 100503]
MSKNRIFKATFIVMAMTILSRIIGFGRDMLAAYHFGVEGSYDIYVASVAIPESVFMIVGVAISTTFIPMLSEIKHNQSKDEMFKFSNNVVTILSILSIFVIILGLIFTKEIVNVFVPKFTKEQIELTIFLTRITLINIVLLCVNACFASMLQVCEDFIVPSLLGLFFNLPIIVYLAFFGEVSIVGLTIANVLGNLLRVLVQIPSLYKQGYKFKLYIDLKDEKLRNMMTLILPVIVGAGANSINMLVDKSLASGLTTGAMASLEYSQRIVTFANTAITTSIVSVVYPLMANRLNSGDNDGFIKYLTKSIIIICLFLVPITFGMLFLSKEIVAVFYERGKFDSSAVILTSMALLGYSLQLPFAGIRDILNSSLFSMKKTKLTTINGLIGVIINIILSIILSKYIGVLGIATATSTSSLIIALLLLNSTRKLVGGFNVKEVIIKISKVILSSSLMILILYFINNILGIESSFTIILIDGSIGAILFMIMCKILKIEEFDEALNMIKGKFKREV